MIRCIECGGEAELVGGERIYPHRPDLHHRSFYLCACGAYCGTHKGTTAALGSPCGPETRAARQQAHAMFDQLWQSHIMDRSSAYAWLADEMGMDRADCHIGMMTKEQAKRVVGLSMLKLTQGA